MYNLALSVVKYPEVPHIKDDLNVQLPKIVWLLVFNHSHQLNNFKRLTTFLSSGTAIVIWVSASVASDAVSFVLSKVFPISAVSALDVPPVVRSFTKRVGDTLILSIKSFNTFPCLASNAFPSVV
ncbi:hypothetical protein D3C85_1089230 [compost metagenome]